MEPMQSEEHKSSIATLVIAWLVGLPLLWGIEQTVKKALALFH